MYFVPFLTNILTDQLLLSPPKLLTQANFCSLNRFFKAPRGNSKFGGNFSYFSLCLTDKLTMNTFLHYPPTVNRVKCLTSNMLSDAPRGQIKKVMIFTCDLI